MDGEIIRDLGDGLVLRRSTPQDARALEVFNGTVHAAAGTREPNRGVAAWASDLASRPHPTFRPNDFTIVEDTRTGTIVSSLGLISQAWSYDGVEFGVGRPELVGTLPEYRQRGLVRLQLDAVHRWSAERGQRVQAISGIPMFYRQFGYEMALALHGGRGCYRVDVPPPPANARAAYYVRPALPGDLSVIASLYREAMRRYLVTAVRDAPTWAYELAGREPSNAERRQLCVVESRQGAVVGFVVHHPWLWPDRTLTVISYELKGGVSWLTVSPYVLRYLDSAGQELARRRPGRKFAEIALALGTEHPAYEALGDRLLRRYPPYAWYIRVPDLPEFVRLVAPVLEQRLARSIAAGFCGALRLDFYRTGVCFRFERGRLVSVKEWSPAAGAARDARFPGLAFLQLVFGYRSVAELEGAFADCEILSHEARVILSALFPRRASHVWAVA